MSTPHHTIVITPSLTGERLDKALASLLPALSRARLQSLIELGHVTLSAPTGTQKASDGAAKVKPGQIYTVQVPEITASRVEAQEIPLDIVFEDAHLLVINKPPGMTVHPAPGSPDSTLVNALLAHCGESLSGIGGVARPGIVHRIDKDTSGLLVVAKHDRAHHHLSKQLAERTLKRTYLAVVHGVPSPARGTITGNIGRHPKDRQRMAVVEGGKHAVTHYKIVRSGQFATVSQERTLATDRWPLFSLIECQLETGRTHQIRVHFAHIKHPLMGDPVYGKRGAQKFPRQALHAWKLALIHPETGKEMQFEAPLPEDMQRLVEGF